MNKAVPWRIKGVGFDARAAAIEAARRSGMSLGEWLNSVIADQAAADGVEEDDFNADDRLDAVTRRLSTLHDGRDPSRSQRKGDDTRIRRSGWRAPDDAKGQTGYEAKYEAGNAAEPGAGYEANDEASHEARYQAEYDARDHAKDHARDHAKYDTKYDAKFDETAQRPMRRDAFRERDPFREQVDAEALLENAISAFDRRASRSNERTARALAEVADLIDSNRHERKRDDAALASIADRLTHIERKVARPQPAGAERSVTDAVTNAMSDAMTRIERRFAGLAQSTSSAAVAAASAAVANAQRAAPVATPGVAPVSAPSIAASASPGVASSGTPSLKTSKRPLAAAIAEVARRQKELDDPQAPALRFTATTSAPAAPPVAPAVEPEPSATEKRLALLVERLEQQASKPAEPPRAADFSGLQGNIDTLSDRIEKMRGEMSSRASAPVRGADGIVEVRREIAALAEAVAGLAPRASIAALETAVRGLASRITDSRMDGVGEAALAPVEGLLHELISVVRGMDSRGAIEALDRSIRGVVAKLEAFDGAVVADPALAQGIADQTREMRDMLAQIHANQLPSEQLEQGLADLGRRVEAIGAAGADPLGRGEMVQRVDEIRSMLDDPKMQEQLLQVLERRLEDIAQRIDAVFGERLDTMQRTVAGLQQATAPATPDFGALVGDLETRIDAALSGGLLAMERTVSRLVEAGPARNDAPSSRLEEMVRDLAARVEQGAAPGADSDTLDAVSRQIERLSQHFDRSDRTSETLVSLQHSVTDLFARLEQSQHEAIDLAEVAARTAAAEVLRGANASSPDVSREVAEIRSLQDAADHRTHATLTAVHDTLSEVVGRLSLLEDDIADVRSTGVTPVPTPAMPGGAPSFKGAPYADPPPRARAERAPERADVRAARPDLHADLRDDEADVLIEPGAAFDRRPRGDDDERIEHRPQASFIQAARRAAQAAGAASEAAGEQTPSAPRGTPAKGAAPLDQIRAYYASRKRPILLSLAALMVLVGAWQVAKVVMDERAPPPPPAVQAPKVSSLPSLPMREKAEKSVIVASAPSALTAPTLEAARKPEAQALPAEASPPASPLAGPQVTPQAAPQAAPQASVDRAPVGSIGQPSPTVDTNGIVRALAISGDPAAQYELAVRYADGKLLARDLKLSQQWFDKAAAKGVVPAQYRLGALYERGIGVPKDPAQAKVWYQRAADAGNARAMHNLAVLFADGSDGKPNYADAIIWFRRGAEFGVRDSQYNLAILYARGLGTPVNMVEAYLWFAAAAAQGDEDAGKKREDVAGRLPAADLVRAKALFAAFKAKTLDAAANEVAPPPGGWESMKAPPRPDAKTTTRPRISTL